MTFQKAAYNCIAYDGLAMKSYIVTPPSSNDVCGGEFNKRGHCQIRLAQVTDR